MNKFTFLMILFLLPAALLANDLPEGWVPFAINDKALECGNHSKQEWKVIKDGENVKVEPFSDDKPKKVLPFSIENEKGMLGERHIQKVNDGWIIGFNAGEFGGSLWWFNENGKSRKKLIDKNVVGLVRMEKDLWALTGLAHLGSDYGKVWRIVHNEQGWIAEELVDIGAAPTAFAVETPDLILILTTKNLIRVTNNGKKEELLSTRYQFLYSNSVVLLESGAIYVGMRHFITRLTPIKGSYKEEWFVPQSCQRFDLKDLDCVCK